MIRWTRTKSLSEHIYNTSMAWASHRSRGCTDACAHDPIPALCLNCEYGRCDQGCESYVCACKSNHHLRNKKGIP